MKNKTILWLLLLVTVVFSQLDGRRTTQYGFDVNFKPPVYYDVYVTYSLENSNPQLNILFNIQNDLLFFTKSDSGYVGGYDISLAIKDIASNSTVFSHLWREKIFEKNFEKTNSKERYQVNGKSLKTGLISGEYEVHLELTDQSTGNSFKSKRKLAVPDSSTSPYFSEIKFLKENEGHSLEIVLGDQQSTVDFNNDLFVNFDILQSRSDQLTIESTLYYLDDEEKTEVKRTEHSLSLDNRRGKFSEIIPRIKLEEGKYLLSYKIITAEGESEISKKFSVVWYDKPLYLYSNELSVPPLKYLLSPEEWEKVDNLSDEDLSAWIENFWQKKDPDPETPLNEIMVEFYKRVYEANKKYPGEYVEGWTTDRGKSLILYGEPDRVEAYRYKLKSKPYEIWYYESENKKLVFIDVDEDDSYPLMSVEDIGDQDNE